jgi:hypothetical protein
MSDLAGYLIFLWAGYVYNSIYKDEPDMFFQRETVDSAFLSFVFVADVFVFFFLKAFFAKYGFPEYQYPLPLAVVYAFNLIVFLTMAKRRSDK